MTYPISGRLGPASGAISEPLREKVVSSPLGDVTYKDFTYAILVERTNLLEYEHAGCPKCGNHRDMIILSIDKKAAFYDCPCSHRWVVIEGEPEKGKRDPYAQPN